MARERNEPEADLLAKEIIEMLYQLETYGRLSDWEQEFVASVTDRFVTEQQALTPNQFATLKRIYQKIK